MDFLASIEPQDLALSKNPIVHNVDPVSPTTYPQRSGLRYLLEVWVPTFFQSTDYQVLATLEASEEPPETLAYGVTFAGAYYDLSELLHGLLESSPPVFGQSQIRVCDTLTAAYYTCAKRYDGLTLIDSTLLPSVFVFRGGIGVYDFQDFNRSFFTRHTEGRKFLTYKPDNGAIRPDQPEYLAYLTNFSPVPSELRLRVEVTYEDHSQSTFTALTLPGITGMTAYSIPVGMVPLGLNALPKEVKSYRVWVSNQHQERLSEIRNYRVDRLYVPQVRYILFENSLGGFDTLALTGDGTEVLKVARQFASRFTGYDYLATAREQVINRVTGERELSVAFGYPTQDAQALREWWQEICFSEVVLLFTDERAYPLTPLSTSYVPIDDKEALIGRSMSFRYTNSERSYSKLTALTAAPSRPTGWRGDAPACEVNAATGLRTGLKRYGVLVQYYLDTNENVKPYTQRPNSPGTEGYVPPWESADCTAPNTPFLNSLVSRPSTLVRANCAEGYLGGPWTISVAANTFGSETSQLDADARALAALNALDTQANANLNGSCILRVPIPLSFQHFTFVGQGGLLFTPLVSIFVDGIEVISNVNVDSPLTYAAVGVSAGVYNIDVRFMFPFVTSTSCKVGIPAKGMLSGTIASNKTYRFANVVVNWGDPEIAIVATRV